jgi:hypothetical protein
VVLACRVLTAALFVVMVLGALDLHGVIAIPEDYLRRVDMRKPDVLGVQSLFWNPGWFA